MQLVVLIALVLTISAQELAPAQAGGWVFVGAIVLYLVGSAALGVANTALALRALFARSISPRAVLQHRLLAMATSTWLILGGPATVLLGYGRWIEEAAGLAGTPLLPRLAALLPFVAALLLMWVMEYPHHRAVRQQIALEQQALGRPVYRPWSLREYLGYNTRHHLLFILVPVGLILLIRDVLGLYIAPLIADGDLRQAVLVGGYSASALTVFLLAPLMIVRIWKTRRLADGDVRAELEAICRRLKLGYRDILVWRSGGTIANAGVIGIWRPVRYVLLSDGLLESLDRRQVRAVFAHEAGHIACHHILYAAIFALSSIFLFGAIGDGLFRLGAPDPVATGISLGGLVVAWWLGFGWLSRRFERQSDVIGALLAESDRDGLDGRITPAGAYAFATALQEVARMNGSSVRQSNWRHGSVAWRVDYLLQLAGRGGGKDEIDRVVRRIKIALLASAVLAAGLSAIVYLVPSGA